MTSLTTLCKRLKTQQEKEYNLHSIDPDRMDAAWEQEVMDCLRKQDDILTEIIDKAGHLRETARVTIGDEEWAILATGEIRTRSIE